ncbi:MAG: ribonuclease III [Micropepsaceae bacterium]
MSGELQTRLGHRFASKDLLNLALTHASAAGARSNERLEFLGDRVLGLVVAGELISRFPAVSEGELAIRLNALVRKDTCARIGEAIGLIPHLKLAPGERMRTGTARISLVGNACEAVIAALYLDGGLEAASRFILKEWAAEFDASVNVATDIKSELQQWAQAREDLGRVLPAYTTIDSSGPAHAPHFVVEVVVEGAGAARGEGASKREAERNAAAALLAQLKGVK